MNRADKRQWKSARSMADAGELTARWLEGRMAYYPGYCAPGPDPETAMLAPVLAAACRAGYVTYGSQPGFDLGADAQRAGVEGFAGDAAAARLRAIAAHDGLHLIAHKAARWRTSHRDSVVVTRDGGRDFTSFGSRLSRGDIGLILGPAWGLALDSWQVTLIDLDWGRNDRLWPALERFAATASRGAA